MWGNIACRQWELPKRWSANRHSIWTRKLCRSTQALEGVWTAYVLTMMKDSKFSTFVWRATWENEGQLKWDGYCCNADRCSDCKGNDGAPKTWLITKQIRVSPYILVHNGASAWPPTCAVIQKFFFKVQILSRPDPLTVFPGSKRSRWTRAATRWRHRSQEVNFDKPRSRKIVHSERW